MSKWTEVRDGLEAALDVKAPAERPYEYLRRFKNRRIAKPAGI